MRLKAQIPISRSKHAGRLSIRWNFLYDPNDVINAKATKTNLEDKNLSFSSFIFSIVLPEAPQAPQQPNK
jgi:hypothetical protein